MPFELGKLSEIGNLVSTSPSRKEFRELLAIFGDAWSGGRSSAYERMRRVRDKGRSDQPHGRGKALEQRPDQAHAVLTLMDRETPAWIPPTQERRLEAGRDAQNQAVAKAFLQIRKRRQVTPPGVLTHVRLPSRLSPLRQAG